MKDRIKLRGYLKIETLNKDTKETIEPDFEDHNLIMDLARPDMSGLIAGHTGVSGPIGRFSIGTQGHVEAGTGNAGENVLIAKTSAEGFIASRTELFSSASITPTYTTTGASQIIAILSQNEIVYNNVASSGAGIGVRGYYYKFIGATPITNVELNDEDFKNATFWQSLGAAQTATLGKAFAYTINWDHTLVESAGVLGITADDTQSKVSTDVTGNVTTFTFEIPGVVANDTGDGTGAARYSECAMFADASGTYNIFSARCFPARTKDANAILKFTWKIFF